MATIETKGCIQAIRNKDCVTIGEILRRHGPQTVIEWANIFKHNEEGKQNVSKSNDSQH